MGHITASSLEMPPELATAISTMRRDPLEFTVLGMSKCRFCYKASAFDLGHELNPTNAGCWCPVHGWLWFDASTILPTEEYIPKKKRRKIA